MATLKDDVVNLSSSNILEPTEEEKKAFQARMVEVAERGYQVDVYSRIELNDGYEYEWIYKDPKAIVEAEAIGFTMASKEHIAGKPVAKVAGKEDGTVSHVDTILMRIPKWKHEIIHSTRNRLNQERHKQGRTSVEAKSIEGSFKSEIASQEAVPGQYLTKKVVPDRKDTRKASEVIASLSN